ncbi:MAG: endonuclease III domain-containing protein [bacterium]
MPDQNPWWVLLGAVLSTRTRDTVTAEAVKRLRLQAPDAATLARLNPVDVARVIYPIGFYRTKAKRLVALAQMIQKSYQGKVPDSIGELMKLPGVGRKVANIVLSQGFGIPAIAVDTHVHRISNRLGLVLTGKPVETERRLREIVPVRYWREWNRLFVALGQTVCLPRNPHCDLCPLQRICLKSRTRAGKGRRGRRGGSFQDRLVSAGVDVGDERQ